MPLSAGANSFQMSISLLLLRDPQPKAAELSPGIAIDDLLSCKNYDVNFRKPVRKSSSESSEKLLSVDDVISLVR